MSKHLPEVMGCFIIRSLDSQFGRFQMLRKCTMMFSDAPTDILPPPVPAQNIDLLLLLSSQFENATMTSPVLI